MLKTRWFMTAAVSGLILVALCPAWAGPVGGRLEYNSRERLTCVPWTAEVVGYDTGQNMIVYSDDVCYGRDYLLQALTNLGIAYTVYYADPVGFETALQAGGWDIILVSHDLRNSLSRVWDEIYNAVLAGDRVAVSTYDSDGSHDQSGYVDELYQAIGATGAVGDIADPAPIYPWIPARFVLSHVNHIGGTIFDTPDPEMNCYVDDGDRLTVASPATAVQGWVNAYTPGQAATVNKDGDCHSVYMPFIPDNYLDDDNGNGKPDAVELWENIVVGLFNCVSATESSTWGEVKTLYR